MYICICIDGAADAEMETVPCPTDGCRYIEDARRHGRPAWFRRIGSARARASSERSGGAEIQGSGDGRTGGEGQRVAWDGERERERREREREIER